MQACVQRETDLKTVSDLRPSRVKALAVGHDLSLIEYQFSRRCVWPVAVWWD